MKKIQDQIKQTTSYRPNLSELYSEIELTEEEKAEAIEQALYEARHTKFAIKNHREYLERLKNPPKAIVHTSKELFYFLQHTEGFVIDSENEAIVKLLCQYFGNDPEFETGERSLSKGLLLFGDVGVGKTHLLHTFTTNQNFPYRVVSCQDVESVYAKNGHDMHPQTREVGLKMFFGNSELHTPNIYGHEIQGFCFDDLGQEITNTKYYGTERNVMQEVLSQRYKLGTHNSTHITTNLSSVQIKEMYGMRVADRMREMFNLIQFPNTAKSRRK